MALPNTNNLGLTIKRVHLLYVALMLVIGIFGVRLFYVQVIRYSHYKQAALSDQLKQYQIPASRGTISVQDNNGTVPIVLNQTLYTLYADPVYIKSPAKVAADVARIIGGQASDYQPSLTEHGGVRYVVLAKRLTAAQQQQILALKLPGLGTIAQDYRTYPQGNLAAQVLGFVNDNGQGEYGVEQALNPQLAGQPGMLKAITDVNGVPLAASPDNIDKPAVPGDNVTLTLNLGMQAAMEKILQADYKATKSQQLSAVIIDPNTGAVKAMANMPTFDPSQYYNTPNPSYFQNGVTSDAIEPGSVMKLLTTAAALNQHVIQPDTTFYDPAHWVVDGFNITDIKIDGGAREESIASTLNLSLNTGATWMLMQMGGGQLDAKGRQIWHDYMVNHFRLGQPTGIQQGYESSGYVPPWQNNGAGIDLTYANTSFGQGVTVTPIQMAAAVSSILNGGIYYKPYVVDQLTKPDGQVSQTKPTVLQRNVVSPQVSQDMWSLMEYVVQGHLDAGYAYMNFGPNYIVGGKTGTAQVADPKTNAYYKNKYNGTYIGFVGGDKPQYVIVVFSILPNVPGYAGTNAGQFVFAHLAHMLIDNGYVAPKSH